MDPTRAVSQDKVDRIVEAARLAPTSSGLQPFEIFVITSKAVREQIQPIAWNQAQIRRLAPARVRRLGQLHARAHQPCST
jgi:nitroreductase